VNDACALLLKEQWPLSWVHGDLCLSNAMVSNGQLVLIDWENVSSQGLVAVDLIRLLYDVWLESARLRRDLRDKAMQVTGHATRRGLEKLGFSRENHRHVGALFVALQCSFVSDRGGKTDKLVRDYRRSVMSILPGN
jgi:thiamine kinase-like enzyme